MRCCSGCCSGPCSDSTGTPPRQGATKKPGVSPASLLSRCRGDDASHGLDVRRLLPLRALRYFEAHLLPFLQRLESRHIDGREVGKQILATAIRGDEAEALGVVE